jgi:AcrR family transcriptional regulator
LVNVEVDKRAEVLERAIEVFSSRGYRATSMKDLADQVNLSKSTLYHYFSSKQDLLVAIYDGVMVENLAAARRITEGAQSPVDSFRQMLVDRVSYTCRNRRILQIFHEEEAELPKRLMQKVNESRRAYQMVMIDLLERGKAEGVLEFSTTAMIVANCLLGACNWSYKWYNPDGPKTPEQLAVEVADLLMGAVLAPPAARGPGAGTDGSAPPRRRRARNG